jgi:hypothetical protein
MQSAQKRASSPEIKRSGRNGAVGLALQAWIITIVEKKELIWNYL